MIRGGLASGVVFSGSGETKATTMNLNNLSDSNATMTRSSRRDRCAKIGWKKTKCCVKKCARCKAACLKLFLISVNFVFMVCGWALVTMGIWIHYNHNSHSLSIIFSSNPTNPMLVIERIPYVLVGVGMVLTITSFLGCCGTYTESVCFLSFYSIFLSLMVITEVIFGIMIGSLREGFSQQMTTSMIYQLKHRYNKTAVAANETALDIYRLTVAWDILQSKMNCCGAIEPKDFVYSSWYNHSKDTEGMFVPQSCCIVPDPSARESSASAHYCQVEAIMHSMYKNDSLGSLYTRGCQPIIMKIFEGYLGRTTFVLVCLICVQFVDLVLACILMSWVKKKQSEYWWCDDDDCA